MSTTTMAEPVSIVFLSERESRLLEHAKAHVKRTECLNDCVRCPSRTSAWSPEQCAGFDPDEYLWCRGYEQREPGRGKE